MKKERLPIPFWNWQGGKELYRKSPHTDAEKNNAPIYLLEGHAFLENNVLYKN